MWIIIGRHYYPWYRVSKPRRFQQSSITFNGNGLPRGVHLSRQEV